MFIELTRIDGHRVLLNSDFIGDIVERANGTQCYVTLREPDGLEQNCGFTAIESYETIKSLLTEKE